MVTRQVPCGWAHYVETLLPSVKIAFDYIDASLLPSYFAAQRELHSALRSAPDYIAIQRVLVQACEQWNAEVAAAG